MSADNNRSQTFLSRLQPRQRRLLAIVVPALLSWLYTYLSAFFFKDYALGLFVGVPVFMGICSTIIYGYNQVIRTRSLLATSCLSLLLFCMGLLVFAWEGVACLIMAAPIGLLFVSVGVALGISFNKRNSKPVPPVVILLFVLQVPVLMAFEHAATSAPALRTVTTSVEINASPETVWKNVVAFPQLQPPHELIFKTGIAYPINATIDGEGVGAIRRCNFSTGSFVEPITAWQQSQLLQFSVREQPETMKELSFYKSIKPNHLEGYWVSKKGEFKLTSLKNGHTLLTGTTWYENRIKPGWYWTPWSDYIVHCIHNRVLTHIKAQAEKTTL